MARRRRAVEALLAEAGCEHLVFCGANRFGSAVQWLTGWPVTAEAVGVLSPGERDALFVQYHNHVPLARRLARDAEVAWGGQSSIGAAIDELKKRGARADRVATIGPDERRAACGALGGVRQDDEPEQGLRAAAHDQVGRGDRLAAHRRALFRSRHAGAARRLAAGPHRARARRSGRARLRRAGRHQRDPLFRRHADARPAAGGAGAVSLDAPRAGGRHRVRRDRAAFWDYPGQVLRRFALGEPTPLYRDLHAAADAAFDAIAAVLRDGAMPRAGDRGRARDRGRGLHHHRRPAARLWRRLPAADPRLARAARPGRCQTSRSAPA